MNLEMNLEKLYKMTILLEHIKAGGKKSCKQVNEVYSYLPKHPDGLLTKKQKIKAIQTFWNQLADETIKRFLIEKQNPENNGNIQEDKPEL